MSTKAAIEARNLGTKPTHFTIREGGDWLPWDSRRISGLGIPVKVELGHSITAIRFSDDTVLDLVSGEWRRYLSLEEKARNAFTTELMSELIARHCTVNTCSPTLPLCIDCTGEAFERALRSVLGRWAITRKEP